MGSGTAVAKSASDILLQSPKWYENKKMGTSI
jgi:hypothetical protein